MVSSFSESFGLQFNFFKVGIFKIISDETEEKRRMFTKITSTCLLDWHLHFRWILKTQFKAYPQNYVNFILNFYASCLYGKRKAYHSPKLWMPLHMTIKFLVLFLSSCHYLPKMPFQMRKRTNKQNKTKLSFGNTKTSKQKKK